MNTIDTIDTNCPTYDGGIPQAPQKLGHTTYDVFVHFSKTSKETLTDKIMRLIRNEINSQNMS